jgi:hypothetical protein
MKILVLCDAGEVRSVAMAKLLRERGHFAVAGSYDNWMTLSLPNMKELAFDTIIFMQEGGTHFIGRDEWGNIDNAELRHKCVDLAAELELL